MSLADRSGVPLTCSLFCFQGKPKHEPKTLKTRRSEYTGRWNVDSSGLGSWPLILLAMIYVLVKRKSHKKRPPRWEYFYECSSSFQTQKFSQITFNVWIRKRISTANCIAETSHIWFMFHSNDLDGWKTNLMAQQRRRSLTFIFYFFGLPREDH